MADDLVANEYRSIVVRRLSMGKRLFLKNIQMDKNSVCGRCVWNAKPYLTDPVAHTLVRTSPKFNLLFSALFSIDSLLAAELKFNSLRFILRTARKQNKQYSTTEKILHQWHLLHKYRQKSFENEFKWMASLESDKCHWRARGSHDDSHATTRRDSVVAAKMTDFFVCIAMPISSLHSQG